MKKALAFLLLLIPLSLLADDEFTPRLDLTKPEVGSFGWGEKTNLNWDVVDSTVAGLGVFNLFGTSMTVQGIIHSSTGGFKFPDNTIQTTAFTGPTTGTITSITVSNGLAGGGNSGTVNVAMAPGALPVNVSLPAAQVTAGALSSSVVASSLAVNSVYQSAIQNLAVNDAKISGVSGSKVSGNISGNAAGITGTITPSQVSAGSLPGNVIVSSLAINSVLDPSIVSVSASKITGLILNGSFSGTYSNPLTLSNPANVLFGDGSNLTGIVATSVAPNTIGTTQIINSTVALVDLNTGDVDTRYLTTGTVQAISAGKIFNASPPFAVGNSSLVADLNADLLDGQEGSFYQSASNLSAGTLPSGRLSGTYSGALTFSNPSNVLFGDGSNITGIVATNIGPNSVGTTQIIDSSVTLSDLNTPTVDVRYLTTGTVQSISGAKTFSNASNTFFGDGSNLTGVMATSIGPNTVGTTQIIDSTVALVDLNTTSVDGRYLTTGTAQSLSGVKTFSAAPSFTAGTPFSVSNPGLVTNLNTDQLDGQEGAFYQDAGNLNAGTVPNARLDGSSVTLQGNTFNGASQLVRLNGSGTLSGGLVSGGTFGAVNGQNLTNLTASAIDAGALGSSVIASSLAVNSVYTGAVQDSSITDAKIVGMSASKLTGTLPALDGSALTNLNASSLASGTVPNSRLDGTSVTLQGNSFNGSNQLVKLNGSGVLSGSLISGGTFGAVNGSALTNLTAANISAGSLGAGVIASSIAVNSVLDASIVGVSGSKVSGDISGNAGSITGTITPSQISAGSLPGTVIASSIAVASVLDASIVSVSGSKVSGNISGNATGITGNINATQINAGSLPATVIASSIAVNAVLNPSIVSVDASKLTGTVPNSTLDSSSITKQGNTFNGASQLVQLNGSSQLPAVSGTNLTNLNASNLASGTVPNVRLDSSSVTLQGNTFNGASQLVQLGAGGTLSGSLVSGGTFGAVNGSALTNLTAANISAGSLGSGVIASSIAVNSVGSAQITNGSIVAADVANNTLTDSQMAAGTFSNISLPAANVNAGSLGSSVIASSIAVNAVLNPSIVSMDASKLTGTIANSTIDASSITKQGNTFNGASQLVKLDANTLLPVNTVGTSQIIASTVALVDINTTDVDTRYLTTGTAQSINAIKSFTAPIQISGADISTPTFISLNNAVSNPTYSEGRIFYDNTEKTLAYYNNSSNVTMNVGQENWIRVQNNSGSTIANGAVVYISGSSGGLPLISLARADVAATSPVVGITTEQIANGAIGYVTSFGLVHNIDTSGFLSGDILYLSSTTAGGLTKIRPGQPGFTFPLGRAVGISASTGAVLVQQTQYGEGAFTATMVPFGGSDGFLNEDSTFGYNSTTKNLSVSTITVGSSGTPVKQIRLYTATVNPGTLTPGSGKNVDVTLTGISANDTVFASPGIDFGNGCSLASVRVTATDTVRLRFSNGDGGSLSGNCTINSSTWRFLAMTN